MNFDAGATSQSLDANLLPSSGCSVVGPGLPSTPVGIDSDILYSTFRFATNGLSDTRHTYPLAIVSPLADYCSANEMLGQVHCELGDQLAVFS